ncbi:MAG: hypothetical protein COU65_00200 [Candidatus Pacebacteria bacterium CG10_big_fil_rev_8_21_14_0_10_42_12]|nr:MAG: hypothetical protein COU65_00200 [Candidatus Pacebacteria bacterium CG10_big_fil_rev_8_21_14_0_10_42_12]
MSRISCEQNIFHGEAYFMDFSGETPRNYNGAKDPEEKVAIASDIARIIHNLGYSKERTIFVNSFPGCQKKVVFLTRDERLVDLDWGNISTASRFCAIQEYDETNRIEVEGIISFADYLLMMKPGDCFSLLINANTKLGPCCGIVHAGRKQVIRGTSFSWVQSLIDICNNPSDISVMISPGLQAPNHVICPDFHDDEFGTVMDLQRIFGEFATQLENGISLDIEGYLIRQLSQYGINVSGTGICTYDSHKNGTGYSYRYRAKHGGQAMGNLAMAHLPKVA